MAEVSLEPRLQVLLAFAGLGEGRQADAVGAVNVEEVDLDLVELVGAQDVSWDPDPVVVEYGLILCFWLDNVPIDAKFINFGTSEINENVPAWQAFNQKSGSDQA